MIAERADRIDIESDGELEEGEGQQMFKNVQRHAFV